MGVLRSLAVTLQKNLRLKSRSWPTTVLELALPVALIAFLIWIRTEVKSKNIEAADYINNPLNDPTYLGPLNTSTTELETLQFYSGANLDGFMQWHLQTSGTRLGVVGQAGAPFHDFLSSLPGYEDLVLPLFPTVENFNSYLSNNNYGYVFDRPQIFAAIEVTQSGESYGFTFHLNSTGPGVFPREATAVNTRLPTWSRFSEGLDMTNTRIYWSGGQISPVLQTGGLLDLQALAYSWLGSYMHSLTLPSISELKRYRCTCQVKGHVTENLAECAPYEVLKQIMTPYLQGGCLGRLSGLFALTWREIPFPTPAYVEDRFAEAMQQFFGLFFTIVFIWPLTRIMKALVEDKELKINETMHMMGMPSEVITLGWYATYSVLWLVPAGLIPLVAGGTVFENSNGFLIFLFFWMFGVAVVAFCAVIAVFFSRAKTASVVGALLFFLLYFPYVFIDAAGNSSESSAMLGCLSPPVALSLGVGLISRLESSGFGLQWGTLNESDGAVTMSSVFVMLVVDILLFVFLQWYLEKIWVVGGEAGRKWYFPCTFHYWREVAEGYLFQARNIEVDFVSQELGTEREAGSFSWLGDEASRELFERVGPDLASQCTIRARRLHKTFNVPTGNGTLVAVNDVSFDLYSNQIFCLLGHNGAGKSTTISLLTGTQAPTSGDANIFGLSITRDLARIRKILGVCPQHNVVWKELTVAEHLRFFAVVKNLSRARMEEEVGKAIEALGLTEKTNSRARTLSGGQQRRLSMAIAMVGDSKVIFLDEPTSGVDPSSRRDIWESLRSHRASRTIILTTHFMDEAETLGDRIAIMSAGRVQCCGSPMFLKSRYGIGYTITLSKTEAARLPANRGLVDRLRSKVLESLEGAEVISDVGGELAFRTPFEAARGFPALLKQLELHGKELGVQTFAVSVTTFEEVFLKVGRDAHAAALSAAEMRGISQTFSSTNLLVATGQGRSVDHHGGSARDPFLQQDGGGLKRGTLFASHVHALLVKRMRSAIRDRRGWCWQLAMPLVFLSLALFTLKFAGLGAFPKAMLESSALPRPQELLFTAPKENEEFARAQALLAGKGTNVSFGSIEDFNSVLLQGYHDHRSYRFGAVRFSQVPAKDTGTTISEQVKDSKGTTYKVNFDIAPPERPGQVALSVMTNSVTAGVPMYTTNLTVPVGTPPNTTVDMPVSFNSANGKAVNLLVPIPLSKLNNRLTVDLFWNSTARDAVPILYTELVEMMLQQHTPELKLQSSAQPFPLTSGQKSLTDTQTSLFLSLGFAFIPASYCALIVKERETGAKHQQIVSGVNCLAYWVATWLWDFINYLVPACLSLLMIAAFGVDSLTGWPNWPWTVLVMLMYGFSVTSFTYMLSFFFRQHSSAQNIILIMYILTGGILEIVAVVLAVIDSTKDLLKNDLIYIFRIIPNFCLADALNALILREQRFIFGTKLPDPWDLDVTGYDLIFMGSAGIIFFLITLMLELSTTRGGILGICRGYLPSLTIQQVRDNEDADVLAEESRVLGGRADHEMVVLKALRKVYSTNHNTSVKVAIDSVSFGIPEGQCFGYLGVNGAGKTTTMKILTGEILPTSGSACLSGFDIVTQQRDVRHLLGYCPQFDTLIELLTAREHLNLFARIKGLPEKDVRQYVIDMLEELGLTAQADRPAVTYSGGNRRKLSLGIALTGGPRIVFLDEPTTGVDPAARRFLWQFISCTMAGRSVILTTHSMDECEALCSRIGIMAAGRLKCLGSSVELRAKHGACYELNVTFKLSTLPGEAHAKLTDLLSHELGTATCVEGGSSRHSRWKLPQTLPLSKIFNLVQTHRGQLDVEEYSVSEATLEQIFLQFAEERQEDRQQP